MKLGSKEIGGDSPTFVIAEIGINHCGQINLAKQLIDMAKRCGADCVKFQKRVVEDSFTKSKLDEEYNTRNSYGKTYGLHKHTLELSHEDYRELKKYADDKDIMFIATPCDIASVDFLDTLNVPFFKIASGDLRNRPLIEHVISKGKPLVISTGMSNMETVKEVYEYVTKLTKKLVLLSCTSSYPAPPEDIHLNVLKTYQNNFNECVIGYSGHEHGIMITYGAVAMGAKVIERHVTLDKNMRGSDHICSLNENELKELIDTIRIFEVAKGGYEKKIRKSEKKVMAKLTKSIVSAVDIMKGNVITRKMLTVKHPGIGISPMRLNDIIGKIAQQNIEKDDIINESMLL
jgi:sialic acid synthase